MLFRPETSLMPSVLALSGFFIDNFPHIYWYPYWYLGNPFHYLIGPVAPVLLMFFTGITPFSLYCLYLGLIVISVLVGGFGIYLFVREWEEDKFKVPHKGTTFFEGSQSSKFKVKVGNSHSVALDQSYKFAPAAFISGLLYVLLPFSWFGLYYQNGLKMVAFAVIPFVFIFYRRFLLAHAKSLFINYFFLVLLIVVCLLVTINVLLPLIIGVAAIFITVERLLNRAKISPVPPLSSRRPPPFGRPAPSLIKRETQLITPFNKGGEEGFPRNDSALWAWREEKIVQTIVVFFLALSFATFWYTPGFWFVLLTNPSLGGVPLWNLIVNLFHAALNFLPLILAILVVKWRSLSSKNLREIGGRRPFFFAFLFFLSFLFLTIVRLLADPKFVIDWIGFFPELQFGASMLGGVLCVWLLGGKRGFSGQEKIKIYLSRGLVFGFGAILVIITGLLIYSLFYYSKSDYQKQILTVIQPHIKDKNARVFLSGSDVFWINSFLPHMQVRGGNEGGSIHPYWSHGAYQIREGEKAALAVNWLKIFGSSYILLHKPESSDPFHDFKHPEKFKLLDLLADKNGDMLYKIPKAYIARVADRSILDLKKPKGGADEKRVSEYVSKFKREVGFNYLSGDTFSVKSNILSGEVINLALSYDPSWKIESGEGRIVGDSLGNLVIVPSSTGVQEFVLKYEKDNEYWKTLLVILILSAFLWKYKYIYPRLRRLMPKIHLGLGKEE